MDEAPTVPSAYSNRPDHSRTPDHSWLDAVLIFRAFAMAFSVQRIVLALVGVIATGVFGYALDVVWPDDHTIAYQKTATGIVAEPELVRAGIPLATEIDGARVSLPRMGNFAFLADELRYAEDGISGGVRSLSLTPIALGFQRVAQSAFWLAVHRTTFAILFFLGVAANWSFVGAALARSVALTLTRDDDLSWRAIRGVAQMRFLDIVLAKLIPLGGVMFGALLLAVFGLLAAIPGIGEIIYVVGFLPLVVGGGILMALAVIVGFAAIPMMAYPVVVDGMDCADAAAAACSYVIRRPARFAFYVLVSLIGGAILLTVLKLIVMFGLALAGSAVSSTMGLDSVEASTTDAVVTISKTDAIWMPPALDGTAPFYGTISDSPVSGWLGIIRAIIRLALMLVWAILAAILVAYGYGAAGASYLLLRRSVDRADITELPLENADKDHSSVETEL